MKHEHVGGNTLDLAELVVDYTKRGKCKTQIKGVPPVTKWSPVRSALSEWGFSLFPYALVCIGMVFALGVFINVSEKEMTMLMITSIAIYVVIVIIVSLCHLNPKFDLKWKKYFAIKTGDTPRNRCTFSQFNSNVFVIYNFDNTIMEYTATKDVARQLKKIWIKKESQCSIYNHQAKINNFRLRGDGDKSSTIWNAYFFFEKIPKDGKLYLEWR